MRNRDKPALAGEDLLVDAETRIVETVEFHGLTKREAAAIANMANNLPRHPSALAELERRARDAGLKVHQARAQMAVQDADALFDELEKEGAP